MNDIKIYVQEPSGDKTPVDAPTDMGLSLMEVLKASGYPIAATCGGMALCATCHIEVLSDHELPPPSDDEGYMLDSLPAVTDNSRLSCQVRLTPELDELVVKLGAGD
ncbi:ferredoxin [Adhaeribacter aerolatus]|uniref:Ferredoxin n=1 Tax=Adhaeribacter aerolatus TaxID=670289 RepID=A0A512ASL9_9BACT|nr:2Fe-2S iron-sulfur cluster-binding protein [Adhaeribacter aerolatus]GEO02567.1 ferredoxin [Adhaeribacter aerolatus]